MRKWLVGICIILNISVFGQVTLQTGAAEASFPLFQYNDAKTRLTTGVSLEYVSGSGMRSNDVASCVGTGWELQVGGFISRLQHGEPDDQKMVNNLGYEIRERIVEGTGIDIMYPNGYLHTVVTPETSMPRDACYTPIFVKSAPAVYKPNFEDREQDVFVFQFNGRSGRFVIGRNREVEVLEDSKLRIKFNESDMLAQKTRTTITDFTITDEDGIQYRFAEKELTEVVKYKTSTVVNSFTILKGELLFNGAVNKIVTRWMLTEINNPLTNEKIIFNYEDYDIDMDGPRHINQTKVGSKEGKNHMVIERIKRTSKRLLSIVTPDSYQVNFNYSSEARIDVPNEKPLKNIAITYCGNLLYGYDFNYAYFKKDQIVAYSYSFVSENEKRYARLCLTDFKKVGEGGLFIPPYKFTYNMPPSGRSDYWWTVAPQFTLWSDHWGYFNPWNRNVFEDASTGDPERPFGDKICEFSDEYLLESYGILKSIIYPEGGELEYTFEHNQAAGSPYTNNKIGGIRVKQTKLYDGFSHANDIIKDYKYVNADNTTSGWGFELPKYRQSMGLRQFKFSSNDNIKGSINSKELGTSLVSTLLSVRMSQMASGALGGSLFNAQTLATAGAQMVIALVITQIIDYFTPDYKDYGMLVIKSDNFNLINPLPHQYSRVEVKTLNGNSGKIVYEFTDPSMPGYVFRDPGPFAAPFSDGKHRYVNWFYGAPRFITWFDEAGQPVRRLKNEYNPIVREINNSNYLSRAWYVNTVAANKENNHNLSDYDLSFTTQETYYPIQGRLELSKTIETNYNKNGEAVSTEASYTYSPNNFQVRTVSKKDSKGDYVGSTTYYTDDYDIAGAINDMKSANMKRVPVSVNNWIKSSQPSSQEQLVSAKVIEYGKTGNDDFRPVKTYTSELKAPQSIGSFDAGNYKNFSYLKPQSALVYSGGNLVQTTTVYGNTSKSAIYDYHERQVVAEVSNAIIDEIGYTSFEADGGSVTYNAAGIVTTFCATGKKCYNLSLGNVTLVPKIVRVRPYIVSLWTTGNQVAVSLAGGAAQTPSITGPVINGWTYYEYELPAGSLADINISGNGLLDEVRYHPKNALMTSYTYDPGIGKTSECDPNNRITKYEYDGLGRLVKVRDQYNNLIKTFEYNYQR